MRNIKALPLTIQSYGQCLSFSGQADGQQDKNYMYLIYGCGSIQMLLTRALQSADKDARGKNCNHVPFHLYAWHLKLWICT